MEIERMIMTDSSEDCARVYLCISISLAAPSDQVYAYRSLTLAKQNLVQSYIYNDAVTTMRFANGHRS